MNQPEFSMVTMAVLSMMAGLQFDVYYAYTVCHDDPTGQFIDEQVFYFVDESGRLVIRWTRQKREEVQAEDCKKVIVYDWTLDFWLFNETMPEIRFLGLVKNGAIWPREQNSTCVWFSCDANNEFGITYEWMKSLGAYIKILLEKLPKISQRQFLAREAIWFALPPHFKVFPVSGVEIPFVGEK